jgi:3',5'-cyclic AMP phosphodiesterase CpdA
LFTLAHLSDPHLPLPPVRRRDLSFKQATGYGNWLLKRRYVHDPAVLKRIVFDLKMTATDHIAITGDLTNIAHPDEFEQARRWLTGLGPQFDITVIPGNHDAYVAGGVELMQAAAGDSMRGDDGGATFPLLRRRGAVAIVAVNTGVPTPVFMATGRMGAEQAARLAGLLADLKREGLFRVVLIHHPPAGDVSPRKRLTDAGEFAKIVAAHGAELVLHGHNHLQELHWLDGPAGHVPAVGVPSASGAPGKARNTAAYNLYRIEGAPGAWRCEMEIRGLDADGRVVPLKRTVLTA